MLACSHQFPVLFHAIRPWQGAIGGWFGAWHRRRGIDFEISLIYGLPRQTLDSFRASLDWARKTGASRVAAYGLMLLRGTEMHRQRHALGLREALMPRPASDDGRLQEFIPHVVETPTMSTAEWLRAGRLAQEAVAKDPTPRLFRTC